MRTTMQELQRRLFDVKIKLNPITLDEMNRFIEQEKQQIIDAYITSMRNERDLLTIKSAEDYYNETYNQDK
jgi:predicted P-loop ATPase/GTPase